MIIVREAKILTDGSMLLVLETSKDHKIQSVVLWDKDDYGDNTKSHDISNFITGESNVETITIPAEMNPLDLKNNIAFFQVVSSEDKDNVIRAAIYSLNKYMQCLTEEVLGIADGISNCGVNLERSTIKAVMIDLLISSFENSISLGNIDMLNVIFKKLDTLCKGDCGCSDGSKGLLSSCNKFNQF